jgi:hypothetical protein
MRSAARSGFPWWLAALAAVLAFVVGDNLARIGHLRQVAGLPGVGVPAPVSDAASPTGFAFGLRPLILPRVARDTDHWIMQVQSSLAAGTTRVRSVAYDNAPRGREVHWTLPLHLWLSTLARITHAVTREPLGAAVESAALFANPLLLVLFLVALIPVAAWRFGGAAATLLALGLVSSYPFYLYFAAGNAEHQGAAEACALLTVFCLLGGSGGWTGDRASRPSRLLSQRGWFTASALAGGLGLWISTASEAPVLVAVGLGAPVSFYIGRKGPGRRLQSELWRRWGRMGAVVSLGAYLLEYFPSHLGWRLEVNHPLYALAWLGGGEFLGIAGAALTGNPGDRRRPGWTILLRWAALLAILPAAVLLTGSRTFLVSDPFLWKLHTAYIIEFQGLGSYLARRGYDLTGWVRLWPFVLPLIGLILLLRPRLDSFRSSQLALALVPAMVEFLLASQQIRWWGLASGLALLTALPWLSEAASLPPAGPRPRPWRLLALLLVIPGTVSALQLARADPDFTAEDIFGLAERDLAEWIRLRAGNAPVNVLSTPDTTTALIYHGNLTGVGTLYWENREGLKAAAEIFAASSATEAQRLLRARHVTHIVLVSWDPFWNAYVPLARGLPPGARVPGDAFVATLLRGDPLPPWLRVVSYSLPTHPVLRGQRVWLFEVLAPVPGSVEPSVTRPDQGRPR